MMKNFLANLLNRTNDSEILRDPGDEFNAKITPSGRKVVKLNTKNEHYSATVYSNNTLVETKVTKNVKKP